MDLKEKLLEIIGDDEKAKLVSSALGEFMIPKTEYAKLGEKLNEAKTELEQSKVASMDKEQLAEHKLKEVQAKEREYGIKLNRLDAETAFINAGIKKELYSNLLDKAVGDDKEKTMGLVNDFIGILKTETETVIKKTKEDLLNHTKKPNAGDGDGNKIKTPNLRVI